jgi:hypothetical protein
MQVGLTQPVDGRATSASALVIVMMLGACARDATPERNTTAAAPAPEWDKALTYTARVDGARSALVVDVKVAAGFHAYTAGETIGKPMTLEIATDSEIAAAGPTAYPKGAVRDLSVGRSVIVEGRAELVAPLASPAAGKTAKGTFAYQVCTDTACDRPRSVPLSVTVP